MSYFVASQISISNKDGNTIVKFKGGDNNVVSRSNGWTNDASLEKAFFAVAFGEVQYYGKSNRKLLVFIEEVKKLRNEFDTKYGDLYDYALVMNNSIEKIKEYKEEINSQNFVQKYKDEKNKKFDYCIENYDALNNTINEMLKKFKENLEFQLKNLKNYKLKGGSFGLRI